MLLNLKNEAEVVSDPIALLPVQTAKTIRECTALHLAHRLISKMAHFERFENLNILYLNDNRIERVENLETCFRIKELYLQNNRIASLTGPSIANLHFITHLCLSDNALKNLLETLPLLKHMKQLENLDLFGNPLAEEMHYRLHVIHFLPNLAILDRLQISKQERAKSERLYSDLVRRGQIPPEPYRKPIKPQMAFGKKVIKSEVAGAGERIARDSTARSRSKLSTAMMTKAKRIEAEQRQAHRDKLLQLYGDTGDVKLTDKAVLPKPKCFKTGSSLPFWRMIEFESELAQGLKLVCGTMTQVPVANLATLVDQLPMGIKPSSLALSELLAKSTSDSFEVRDLATKLLALPWQPLDRPMLVVRRQQLYQEARDAASAGTEALAIERATAAVAIEQLLE